MYIGSCDSNCDDTYGCYGSLASDCVRCDTGKEWQISGCGSPDDPFSPNDETNCTLYDQLDEDSTNPHYDPFDQSTSDAGIQSKCLDCAYGYMLKLDHTCEACHASCQECENDGSDGQICTTCVEGFYSPVDAKNTCVACHADCETCEFESTNCTACDVDSVLDL